MKKMHLTEREGNNMRIFFIGFLKKEFNKEFIEIKLDKPMDLIDFLNEKIPQLAELVLIETKKLSPSFIFLINGVSIDVLGVSQKILNDKDTLTIIPISHGG